MRLTDRQVARLAFAANVIALIFWTLCLAAGPTPKGLSVFTIDFSRVGESFKREFDHDLESIHLKRSPAETIAMATPALFHRDLPPAVGTALSQGRSTIDSAESIARSKATGGLNAMESQLLKEVNREYESLLNRLLVRSEHVFYVTTTCELAGTGPNSTRCSGYANSALLGIEICFFIGFTFTFIAVLSCTHTAFSEGEPFLSPLKVYLAVLAPSLLVLFTTLTIMLVIVTTVIIDMVKDFTGITAHAGVGFWLLTSFAAGLQVFSSVLLVLRVPTRVLGANEKPGDQSYFEREVESKSQEGHEWLDKQ